MRIYINAMKTPIAIVDDNPLLIQSIGRNLSLYEEIEIVFTAKNGIDLLDKIKQNQLPKVILMDIEMPQMNGIQAVYEVYQRYGHQIKIIMLTVFDQEDKIFHAIQAGASGYLMKDEKASTIINSINEVLAGGSPMSSIVATKILELLRSTQKLQVIDNQPNEVQPKDFELTKRETEILQLISRGMTYKQIAEQLFVSDKTIKKHIENIYNKLHVNSKYEAMQLARRYNWIKI
ncbi:MAG: response regulator transcription factor [Spirosomaceae bacterium]|nr:response regulator transcription factor [Spirosomataceae bacterium]